MKNALAIVAVVIALIAIGLSWSRGSHEVSGSAPAVEVNLEPLIARIAVLEKQTADLRRELESARLESPAREAVPSAAKEKSEAEMARRVEQMEKSLEELRAKNDARLRPDAVAAPATPPNLRETLTMDQLVARARDPRATEAERLEALRAIRGQKLADGTDARLPVLDDMIRLAQDSTDGETRTDVWRQLNHITDSRLKIALLDALATDKFDHAREKAADTLADFMPDAQVEAALKNAAQNDPAKSVRKQAASSLAGGH